MQRWRWTPQGHRCTTYMCYQWPQVPSFILFHSANSRSQVTGHFRHVHWMNTAIKVKDMPGSPSPHLSAHFTLRPTMVEFQAILTQLYQTSHKWHWTPQGQMYSICVTIDPGSTISLPVAQCWWLSCWWLSSYRPFWSGLTLWPLPSEVPGSWLLFHLKSVFTLSEQLPQCLHPVRQPGMMGDM